MGVVYHCGVHGLTILPRLQLAVIWMKGRCAMATLVLARRTHAQALRTRSSHRLALLCLQHQLWLPCSERGPCSREGVWIN